MKPLYLEPDEEITSVIDKLSATSEGKVAIVVPKNSTLIQSLVNLKLLAKQAKELRKDIVLITSNKVGQRLASQVGIPTYSSLGPTKDEPLSTVSAKPQAVQESIAEDEVLPDGTKIHRYTPPPSSEPIQSEARVSEEDQSPVTPSSDSQADDLPEDVVHADTEKKPDSAPQEEASSQAYLEDSRAMGDSTQSADLPPIVARTPTVRREFTFEIPWKSLAAAGILLLVAFSVVYLLLPKATITVTLPATLLSDSLELKAASDIGDDTAVSDDAIPGQLIVSEKEADKRIVATGKKNVGTKAGGNITLYNKASSSSVNLAAGTSLTAAGKNFTLNKAATVPGASVAGGSVVPGEASGQVTATEAGDTHNLSNAQFSVAGQSTLVYGSGSTSGGTTKQVTVLSEEDVNKAYGELESELLTAITEDLKSKVASDRGGTVIEEAIQKKLKDRSVDKAVGSEVEAATVKMKYEASVISFKDEDVKEKVKLTLEKKIEEGKQLVIPEDQEMPLSYKGYIDDNKSLVLEVSASGYSVPIVNKAEIAKLSRHKTSELARSVLYERFGVDEVEIVRYPGWWIDRMPFLSQAITVNYGFGEAVSQ